MAPGKKQFKSLMPTIDGKMNKVAVDPSVAVLHKEIKRLKTQLAASDDKYQEMHRKYVCLRSNKRSGNLEGRRLTRSDSWRVVRTMASVSARIKAVDKTGSLLAVAEAKDNAIFSKLRPNDGKIQSEHVLGALRAHGLLADDLRLVECFQELEMNPELTFKDFQRIKNNSLLMDRALNKQLAIPNFAKFKEGINQCYKDSKHNEGQTRNTLM
jgi:hypothetical protein